MGLVNDGAGIAMTCDDFGKGTASGALNELIKAYAKHIWKTVDFAETAKLAAEANVLLTLCRARNAYYVS